MKLSGWRNSKYRDSPETVAANYRLQLIGDKKNPKRMEAVQILCEFAEASHKQRPVPVKSSLPWEEIIAWWDGEDRQRHDACQLHLNPKP